MERVLLKPELLIVSQSRSVRILAPIHAVIITVGVLILFDSLTGIMAARKRGEKINSSGLRRTLSKAIVYQVAVISAFLVQKYLISDTVPVSKITSGIIGVVELTSIFENLNEVYGSNIFRKILNLLGSPNDSRNKEDKKD